VNFRLIYATAFIAVAGVASAQQAPALPADGAQKGQRPPPPKYDEADLKELYDAFLISQDYVKVATDYPQVIKDLLSNVPELQVKALRTLGATGKPYVIPWMVPFLDSEDASLSINTGSYIEELVSELALQRRDSRQDKVVLRPLAAGDLDLRPLAWVALKMFRKPDDGNTHAYAATMTRYIEIREFEDELRSCLGSRHPAVSDAAKWALEELGLGAIPKDCVIPDLPLRYPPAALEKRIAGSVSATFTVNPDGGIGPMESPSHPLLLAGAEEALRAVRFGAGCVGKPITMRFDFGLNESTDPKAPTTERRISPNQYVIVAPRPVIVIDVGEQQPTRPAPLR